MSMPAIVVNEQVVSTGKVLKAAQVEELLKNLGCQDDNWGLEDPTGKSDEEFRLVISKIEEKIYELVRLYCIDKETNYEDI